MTRPTTPDGLPLLRIDGAVATITLSRPAHRNRLHNEDLDALLAHFDRVNADPAVRLAVFRASVASPASGAQPVFCAGYHLGEFDDESDGQSTARFERVADALESLAPVTVAAVNGNVYGGATDLVLACDFRIGVSGMQMRMPAAALGIHYYPNGLRRYVSRIGVDATKRAFLTARSIGAEELLRMGWLTDLCDPGALDTTVDALATTVGGLAPMAIRAMKASINEIGRGEHDRERLLARERACQQSSDFAEGRLAFAEKRPPRFTGR